MSAEATLKEGSQVPKNPTASEMTGPEQARVLRLALAAAPLAVWSADATGVLAWIEGGGAALIGSQAGMSPGASLQQVFAGDPQALSQIQQALAGTAVRFQHQRGERLFEHWVRPVRDDGQPVTGIAGISIDLTTFNSIGIFPQSGEDHFRALAEGSLQGVVIYGNRRFLYVNPSFARLFGYASPEEIRALPSLDAVIAPEERKSLRDLRRKRLAGERVPEVYEVTGLKKDGSRLHLLVLSRVVHWDGEPAVQSTVIDITGQRRAGEALKESQRLLATVFDTIPHATVVKDREDRYLMVNRAWSDLHGTPAAAVLGRPTEQVPGRPAEELRQIAEEDRRILSGELPSLTAEREMTVKNGERRYAQVVKVPLRDDRGAVVGLVAMNIDLTERKRAESALREKEWMLSRAAQAARVGTWFWEFDSHTLRWSEETFHIVGLQPGRYPPSPQGYFSLIHPDDRAEYRRLVTQVEQNGGNFRHEHRILRPDGELRIVMVIGERFNDDSGRPVGIIGIFQDITNERLAEARLMQAEKMEALGRLTAGIAHDFNNLLTVIRGNLALLARLEQDTGAFQPMLDSVMQAADRGASLVRQLSAIARNQPLVPTLTAVRPILADLTGLLERTLGSTIRVETRIPEGTWDIEVDIAQFQSAILNLAINARDAMPNGGRLMLDTANISLDASEAPDAARGDYVMIAVSDTGIGIPAALREKVFEPFFTTKAPGMGTGLGLSMVFGFVRQSGGHIRLHSEEGRGTTVRMYFPRADKGRTVRGAGDKKTSGGANAPAGGGATASGPRAAAVPMTGVMAGRTHLPYPEADASLDLNRAGTVSTHASPQRPQSRATAARLAGPP
jgi:PAS domain S-box-containing protein